MRIGIDISVLNEKNKTGIGVYTYELIQNYLKIDNNNEIVLFGFSTFSTANYLSSLFEPNKKLKLKIVKIPGKFFRIFFILWQKLNWPKIEFFIGRVDVFHSFNWYLPPQSNGKVIATVFDVSSIKHPQFHHQNTTQLDKLRFARIKKYADIVIAISENAKKEFLSLYSKKKVEVVYPSTQQIFDQPISETNQLLKKYNLNRGYILSVGTLEPRKNIENLIKAYLELGTDKKLVLVGANGWRNEKLYELINANKEKIITTGFLDDKELAGFYKNAFCFVYPSFYEGFGIPVLAALKLGIPVVCSNSSSLPEVGGSAVVYIDPYKYKTIKTALKKLLTDKKLINKLIINGKKRSRLFSYQKSAKKLLNIYESSL